jgi:hypothetical protein
MIDKNFITPPWITTKAQLADLGTKILNDE